MTEQKLNNQEEAAITETDVETGAEQLAEQDKKPVVNVSALFTDVEPSQIFGGGNQLNATAKLTTMSERIARNIWDTVTTDIDTYVNEVKASQKSHDAMDDLISEMHDLGAEDITFLKRESEETLEKMIRSQQSKRSRAKSKAMTQENYLTMMTGAIAENLLRLAADKPKSSGGGAVMGEIGFSAEDLEQLAQFPEELKKAIRNVQSKKSIMKSKADFNILNPRWQQLLRAEQQLKDVRDKSAGVVAEEARQALDKQAQVKELLEKAQSEEGQDAEALLDMVKEILASN